MAVLARCRLEPGRPARPQLTPPERERAEIVDGALVLGFPIAPDEPASVEALSGAARPGGQWAVVAPAGDELVLRADPWGSRPLYWRLRGDEALVADEVWSLLDTGHELDRDGVADLLLCGLNQGDATLWREVRALEADTIVGLSAGGVRRQVLSQPPPVASPASLEAAAEALLERLRRLYDPLGELSPLLVPLSGGLDSRVLLAVAAERYSAVHAWTGVLRPGTEEERIAAAVARELGIPHTVSMIDPQRPAALALEFVAATSAHMSLEHLHGYGAHRDAPERFGIAAYGIHGDIVCGGSRMLPPDTRPEEVLDARIRQLTYGRDPAELQRRLPGAPGWAQRLSDLAAAWYRTVDCEPARSDWILLRNRPGRFNVQAAVATLDRFRYVAPFFNEDLEAVCYGIRPEWRWQSLAYRRAIARGWPALARIPWVKTGLPLNRYPGRRRRWAAAVRRRLGRVPQRAFTDVGLYLDSLGDLVERAETDAAARLAAVGIDAPALLAETDRATSYGRAVRLRLATIQLALEHAWSARRPRPAAGELA